jgi:hypothetical protein
MYAPELPSRSYPDHFSDTRESLKASLRIPICSSNYFTCMADHHAMQTAGDEGIVQQTRSENPIGKHIVDKIYLSGQPLETMHNSLKRETTGAAEFHVEGFTRISVRAQSAA